MPESRSESPFRPFRPFREASEARQRPWGNKELINTLIELAQSVRPGRVLNIHVWGEAGLTYADYPMPGWWPDIVIISEDQRERAVEFLRGRNLAQLGREIGVSKDHLSRVRLGKTNFSNSLAQRILDHYDHYDEQRPKNVLEDKYRKAQVAALLQRKNLSQLARETGLVSREHLNNIRRGKTNFSNSLAQRILDHYEERWPEIVIMNEYRRAEAVRLLEGQNLTKLAREIGVSRVHLNRVKHGKRAFSDGMAQRVLDHFGE